jgi:hypothetical protein
MSSDRSDAPAQPFLGARRNLIQFGVMVAMLFIFLFVGWATIAAR